MKEIYKYRTFSGYLEVSSDEDDSLCLSIAELQPLVPSRVRSSVLSHEEAVHMARVILKHCGMKALFDDSSSGGDGDRSEDEDSHSGLSLAEEALLQQYMLAAWMGALFDDSSCEEFVQLWERSGRYKRIPNMVKLIGGGWVLGGRNPM